VSAEVAVEAITAAEVEEIIPLLAVQLAEHGMGQDLAVLRAATRGLASESARGAILVARRGGAAIGVAVLAYTWTLEHGGKCAWLDELYVTPAERSAGVGTTLLLAALDRARRDGCLAMDLEVDVEHARVESLYARHGFRALPRRRFSLRT